MVDTCSATSMLADHQGATGMDRRLFLIAAASTGLSACVHVSDRYIAGGASAQARLAYGEIFDALLMANPPLASSLGLDIGPRAYLRQQLNAPSARTRYKSVAPLSQALPKLRAIDRSALSGRDRAWLDTAIWFGERAKEIASIPYGGMDGGYPVPYPITQLTGLYRTIPSIPNSTVTIETRYDAEAYLARLEELPHAIDLQLDAVRRDAAMGVVPPAGILGRTIDQTRQLMADQASKANLGLALARRAAERGIPGDWDARAARIADGPLSATLARQLTVLEALQPQASPLPGVSRLPEGERFYAQALRFHTSANLSPAEVHRIGLEQVAELSAEADLLLKGQGLAKGSLIERFDALDNIKAHQFPDGDAGREELLRYSRELMTTLRSRMPEFFRTIPTSPMEVRRVPEAIEQGSPGGYAEPGDIAGTRPGIFYVNLARMNGRARWKMPTLVCHEAIPGHLWQRAILFSVRDIPQLQQTFSLAAYDEGWGLYAETLGDELGLYREDSLGRIGMIQSFLFRAARLVVDTGVHMMGWSKTQASEYFRQVLGQALDREVDRYTAWPGQATAYKIGHNEMLRIREAARQRLGGRFDIKAYHDLVLLNGGMPLEVLAGLAQEWDGGTPQ